MSDEWQENLRLGKTLLYKYDFKRRIRVHF